MKLKFILCVVFILSGISPLFSFQMDVSKKGQRVRAPELNGGVSWLNTEKPLSLAGLKGKIVLLDFWTYGCINCIHIIPKLKELEKKYADQLVVIGVHSAKFDNEKDTENIRKIILRYGLEHPIVNDANFKIWEQYAVKAYPTQILIDPKGYIIDQYLGEGHEAEIDQAIRKTAEEFRKKGELDEKPLSFALERAKVGDLPLAFPGKVLGDEKTNRLYIADSNHNRVVVTDLNGKLLETIGSGKAALTDGIYDKAGFKRPQGLFLDGENLYVADTENHAIRRVNLQTKTVETVAGDGMQADWGTTGGALKTARLSSPWDLVKIGNALYIAMAGTHQIWKLNFEEQTVAPFAGTGAEARYDGALNEATFAQPSGIVSNGSKLWIADSESNIIREIDIQKGTVETLVGGDLYDFGDVDGEEDDVRLQHPLGVVVYDGKILIADTYNHKIKTLDTGKRTVKTFLGSGKSGQKDGKNPTFYEPGGLSIAAGTLFVADTNNHAIRVVDLKTKEVATLKIENLKPPVEEVSSDIDFAPNVKENSVPTQRIAANSDAALRFNISLPGGFHLNPNAPQRFEVQSENNTLSLAESRGKFTKLPLVLSIKTGAPTKTAVNARLTVYYCREDNTGTCQIRTLAWKIPVEVVKGDALPSKIELNAKID